ncbi:MAG: YbaB/EbfC family nucleoid-associated protein [Pseudomonadota bacterium]
MNALMKQAQEMQVAMAKKQEELAARTFEASAGGGMVTAAVSGKHEVVKLSIDRSIVSADDVGMIEDLVIAAVNEAFKKANDAAQEAMSGMMGGLGGLKNMFG